MSRESTPRIETICIDIRTLFLCVEENNQLLYRLNRALFEFLNRCCNEYPDVKYQLRIFGRPTELRINLQDPSHSAFKLSNDEILFSAIIENFNKHMGHQKNIFPLTLTDIARLDIVSPFLTPNPTNSQFAPEFLFSEDPLFVSADTTYLAVAKHLGFSTCQTYTGGELDPVALRKFEIESQRAEVDAVLLSLDIDDTLLKRKLSLQSAKTTLNPFLVEALNAMRVMLRPKKIDYLLLSSRHPDHIVQNTLYSYELYLNGMRALASACYAAKCAELSASCLAQFAQTPTVESASVVRFFQAFTPSDFGEMNRTVHQVKYHPSDYRPTSDAVKSALGISKLPAIMTADPLQKSVCLRKAAKTRQLIAHFDDSPDVEQDMKKNAQNVIFVKVYLEGDFPSDAMETVRLWQGGVKTCSFDFDLLEGGDFVRCADDGDDTEETQEATQLQQSFSHS